LFQKGFIQRDLESQGEFDPPYEKFSYLPCLNDSEAGIDMLEALVRRELSGWIDAG